MSKPNEITRDVLRSRLVRLAEFFGEKDVENWADAALSSGAFEDFIGVVQRTVVHTRESSARIAKRHGHHVTAQNIRRGT